MLYYSTNHQIAPVTLREAVITGLAADNGLFMPERIDRLDPSFFSQMARLSFPEIAFRVASHFFGQEIPEEALEPLLNGHEIMDFAEIKPGPAVGLIREALLQAQIAGEVTSVPGAVEFVRNYRQKEKLQ